MFIVFTIVIFFLFFFFFQAEDGIRDLTVTGVQTCALPIYPDLHTEHLGAWPADVYYGEMDGTWTDATAHKDDCEFPENNNVPGDGKFDQSEIPGDVELEVGRVDMWNLPAFEPRSEVELLRRYLRKNHEFRHGRLRAPPRGLIRDNFGVVQDDAPAVDAWRAFPALFGKNGWKEIGADKFFPTLDSEAYLWAFGAGGGDRDKADGVGWTYDFAVPAACAKGP